MMLKNVNICGVVYDIVWCSEPILDEGREHWAVLNAETRELSMFNGLSEHDTKHLMCHEMYHEVLNAVGLDMDEKYVKLSMRMLFDAIERNNVFTEDIK
jgi:hypothetical protein